MDKYTEDKWYTRFYQNWVLDTKAAELGNLTIPDSLTKVKSDHVPMEPILDMKSVNIPEVTEAFKKQGAYWNYPMLIEAFEAENPGMRFSRAEIKQGIRRLGKPKTHLTQEQFVESLVAPATEQQKVIKSYWSNEPDSEILRYFGVSEVLIEFLVSRKQEVSTDNLSAAELTKLLITEGAI